MGRAAGIAVAAGVAVLAAAPAASAGSTAALDHLSGVRNPATGTPSVPGETPQRVRATAAWAAIAVAAGGEDPAAWRSGGRSLAGAVGRRPGSAVIPVARWTLAAHASRRLTARDALAVRLALAAAGRPDGGIGAGDLDTAWALLALAVTGPDAAAQAQPALAALRARRHADGGWASESDPASDTAATAAAAQALAAWGEPAGGPVLSGTRRWLLAARRPDGGVAPRVTGRSTSVDTAWAALAVWAMGESPRARPWARAGRSPLAFIGARQRADGGVADTRGAPSSTFATALAVLAMRGRPLPVGPAAAGAVTRRAPVVVRRSPAPGDPPGTLVLVRYRDETGGTGVDPASVRVLVGGADLTRAARISRFGLQLPAAALPSLPAVLELRIADRAGNRRVERWTLGRRADGLG
ncbi:MAG: hypothetical protein IT200_05210 [Thermoleophilia bacterium]|nr:hypothetical protein [Thermoleophilia bacterium]